MKTIGNNSKRQAGTGGGETAAARRPAAHRMPVQDNKPAPAVFARRTAHTGVIMNTKAIIMALTLTVPTFSLLAQDATTGQAAQPPRHRAGGPQMMFLKTLDADKDGVLSAAEIDGAPAALKALDANNDGQLTRDELRPTGKGGQPGDGKGPQHRGGRGPGAKDGATTGTDSNAPAHRPAPPILKALDANGDGVLDATEIANAAAALRTLDANNDGQLTVEEACPAPKDGQGAGAGLRHRGGGRGGAASGTATAQ